MATETYSRLSIETKTTSGLPHSGNPQSPRNRPRRRNCRVARVEQRFDVSTFRRFAGEGRIDFNGARKPTVSPLEQGPSVPGPQPSAVPPRSPCCSYRQRPWRRSGLGKRFLRVWAGRFGLSARSPPPGPTTRASADDRHDRVIVAFPPNSDIGDARARTIGSAGRSQRSRWKSGARQ